MGGGSAGSALAGRLALATNASILLVEAGGTGAENWRSIVPGLMSGTWKSPIDWAFQTTPQKTASLSHMDQVEQLSLVWDIGKW